MNILYIHQYFRTPLEPGGTRSYWIGRELINRGHCVTMITSTNSYSHPEPCTENIDGIKVIYVKNEYSNYMSKMRKVYSFVHFLALAIKEGCKQKDVDIVYATSTPLTVGYVAMRLKAKMKFPYVFEVRDLWPEFPIQVGAIKNPLLIKSLRRLERRIYEKSEHVVALSPGMQEGVIAAGIPKEKTSMIPNMAKPDEFFPHAPNLEIAERFCIDTSMFNVIHFGSMGVANGLAYIIHAAKVLKDRQIDDVNFLFMGQGATQPELEQMVRDYGLTNVKFLGNFDMNVVAEVVNLCDASITSFKNLPILATNSPNKLFDSLSAGKPIIVNSPGWTKDMVEKNQCGFYVDVEKPEDLADKLIEVKDNKALLEMWGRNARMLSENIYDRKKLSAQVADVIEKAYDQHASCLF